MRILAAILALLLPACRSSHLPDGEIEAFLAYAERRHATGGYDDTDAPITDLAVRIGIAKGSSRLPDVGDSAIIVENQENPSGSVVQVFVHPQIAGAFLDPENPSREFLNELEAETRRALNSYKYTDAFLVD